MEPIGDKIPQPDPEKIRREQIELNERRERHQENLDAILRSQFTWLYHQKVSKDCKCTGHTMCEACIKNGCTHGALIKGIPNA